MFIKVTIVGSIFVGMREASIFNIIISQIELSLKILKLFKTCNLIKYLLYMNF